MAWPSGLVTLCDSEASLARSALIKETDMNREKPTETRFGLTHKATILAMSDDGTSPDPVEFFIISNTFPDGRLCEIFLTTRKEGSTIDGLLDGIATLTSFCLQSGWPLYKLVEKFSHTKFEPMGYTKGETCVRYAKSILDYVFRYLGETFGDMPAEMEHSHSSGDDQTELPATDPDTEAVVEIAPDLDEEAKKEEARLELIEAHKRITQARDDEDRKNQEAAVAWHAAHPKTYPEYPENRPMPLGEAVVPGDEPRG